MKIDYDVLITYGGVAKKYDKGDFIFHEDTMPYYYFQIITGEVRLFSTNSEGKELNQGFFKTGSSFGEPPLFLGKEYPCTAQANVNSVIVKLRKENFLAILRDFPELSEALIQLFAARLYNKSKMAQIWVQHTPEEKILKFLDSKIIKNTNGQTQPIQYTRQQIADFTGLRVETVIRTLMRMKQEGKVKIMNHKLYY